MDWTAADFKFIENDFNMFQYGEGGSATILRRCATDNVLTIETIVTSQEWKEWLNNNTFHTSGSQEAGICIMLCNREKRPPEDNLNPLTFLPFCRQTFRIISRDFCIHRTISRTVAREAAYFSSASVIEEGRTEPRLGIEALLSAEALRPRMHTKNNGENTVITCRMSSSWPDDLALSITFCPELKFTVGIVFGCNEKQRRQFEGRLSMASYSDLTHPLLLPGIFAELERKRLSDRMEDVLDQFTLRSNSMSQPSDECPGGLNMNEEQMEHYLRICYHSQNLAKEFKSVKRQLTKMITTCEEFGANVYKPFRCPASSEESSLDEKKEELSSATDRIKKRTLEIIDEYDDKIDECEMVMENMSITMQTVWSHIARRDAVVNTSIARANNSIALDTKQDNSQMKSIAVVTMIYLPVSAVASIFSMSMFNWSPKDGSSVSDSIWVFVAVATVLTAATVLVWQIATYWQRKKAIQNEDIELGHARGASRQPW